MGTRSGNVDPAVVEFIANKDGLTPTQTLTMLNKKSGLLGISGVSSDMRDVRKAASEGNERAQIALDMWAYGIRKYIGAYAAAMEGVDAIAFTGGIGENDSQVRQEVLSKLSFLGIELDEKVNAATRGNGVISTENSKVKVLVVSTNEELAIARDTKALCQ